MKSDVRLLYLIRRLGVVCCGCWVLPAWCRRCCGWLVGSRTYSRLWWKWQHVFVKERVGEVDEPEYVLCICEDTCDESTR